MHRRVNNNNNSNNETAIKNFLILRNMMIIMIKNKGLFVSFVLISMVILRNVYQ